MSETKKEDYRDVACQPARAIEALTIGYVIAPVEQRAIDSVPLVDSDELGRLSECLREFGGALRSSPGNIALRDV